MTLTKRYIAVGLLLLVGLLVAQAGGSAADLQTTYDAVQVDPTDDASKIADGEPDVIDLDEWIRSMPSEADDVIQTAIEDRIYDGSVPLELHIRLDDYGDEATVVVYDRQYYLMNATLNDQTADTRLDISPLRPGEAAGRVATPFTESNQLSRRAIKDGRVTTDRLLGEPGLVNRDGTYFLVTPRNEVGWAFILTSSTVLPTTDWTVLGFPAATALGLSLMMVGIRSATGLDLKVQTEGGPLLTAITGAIVGGFVVLYAVLVDGWSPLLVMVYALATVGGLVLWRRHWQVKRANA